MRIITRTFFPIVKRNVSIHTLRFLGHTPLISWKGYYEGTRQSQNKNHFLEAIRASEKDREMENIGS